MEFTIVKVLNGLGSKTCSAITYTMAVHLPRSTPLSRVCHLCKFMWILMRLHKSCWGGFGMFAWYHSRSDFKSGKFISLMTSSLEASDWYCWQYLPAVGGREQVWHTALHTSWAVLPNTLHSTEYLCLDAFWEALQHLSFSQLLSLGLLQSTSRYSLSLHYMPALRSNRNFSGCSIAL